ncbi:MAG: LamG-like jellyroll fold domain-containing protein [Thermoguttaceae bacterium]|nr:LamG-like jellyroll fold domain-containing protein [Thermoguttaceae bacterium]
MNLNRGDLLPNLDPFKLELWINKPSSSPGTSLQYILSNTLSGAAGRVNFYENLGKVIFAHASSGLSLESLTTVNGESFTLRDDQWHKITVTRQPYDSNLDLFELYVDDILHDSKTGANTLILQTTRNWQLGGTTYVTTADRAFKGLIDDVRVYLTPEPSGIVLLLMAGVMLLLRRRGR